jgi:hypothetical protein
VWIEGLIHKISAYLPEQTIQLLSSYLFNRKFVVHYGDAKSDPFPICAGVPQGSVLGPMLYTLYTADISTTKDTMIATFADDTAILAPHKDFNGAIGALQQSLNKVSSWAQRWRIKINASKSVKVDFSLQPHPDIQLILDNDRIPTQPSVRYLGIHIDKKLTWKTHCDTKKTELRLRFCNLFWLMNGRNKISLSNKRLLYVTVLRPLWSYGIPAWGYAAKSNVKAIQVQQNTILKKITNASQYISMITLHHDLCIKTVDELARRLTS